MKTTYRIVANKFTSRAPVTVAQHDKAQMPRANPEFFAPVYGDNAPPEKALREAVASVPFILDYTNEQRAPLGRPYIPGTGFKAKLRNIATDIMTDGLEGMLDHKVMTLLSVGGTKPDKLGDKTKANVTGRDRGLPILALFGAVQPYFTDGFKSFSHLVSEGKFYLTRTGIVRQNYLNQNPGLAFKLSDEGIEDALSQEADDSAGSKRKKAIDKKITKLKGEAAKLPKGSEQLAEKRDEIREAEAELEIVKVEEGVAAGQLHGKWMIPAGINFSFSATHLMSDEEFGLLLKSIQQFALNPFLGGDKSRGAGGDFDVDFSVLALGPKDDHYKQIGTIEGTHIGDLQRFVDSYDNRADDYREIIRTMHA